MNIAIPHIVEPAPGYFFGATAGRFTVVRGPLFCGGGELSRLLARGGERLVRAVSPMHGFWFSVVDRTNDLRARTLHFFSAN